MTEVIERTEMLQPEPCALGALLGVPVPDLEHGAGLPLLWHWVYLLDRPAQADLGPDGHPVRGTLPTPPGPGRRRMWAGGRVRARGRLRSGSPATKRTSVLSVAEKQGRSGHLTFVTVGHQILQDGQLVIDEEQDIVYRGPRGARPPTRAAAAGEPPPRCLRPVSHRGPASRRRTGGRCLRYAAVPLFRADLQRAPHPLRPGLLPRRGGLPGPAHPRPAAGDRHGGGGPRGRPRRRGDLTFEYRLVSPLFDYQGLIVRAARGQAGAAASARDRYGRADRHGHADVRVKPLPCPGRSASPPPCDSSLHQGGPGAGLRSAGRRCGAAPG